MTAEKFMRTPSTDQWQEGRAAKTLSMEDLSYVWFTPASEQQADQCPVEVHLSDSELLTCQAD
ncbi:hypothetical protein [Streptomyces mirabilis]|uniref:hypothetical protein n=1 Tax=Streptomyces mirabilis TaxID=68239 RepID=UPI00368769B5